MEPEVTTAEAAVETPEVPVETGEETPATETLVETPPEPKKKTAQERIDEITRKRREAEREAEYWKSKALQSPEPPKPVQAPVGEARPKVDQFETVEAYEDALLTWHERKRTIESSLTEQNKRKKQAVETFNSKADALRAEYDDYDDVINAPIFTDMMKSVLLTSENGPELAYHLGLNRSIADKIAKLPAELQPYELGKLETHYLLQKKNKKTSTAPAPISPIGATGEATKIDESKLSDDDWFRLEQKRKLEKLKKLRGD